MNSLPFASFKLRLKNSYCDTRTIIEIIFHVVMQLPDKSSLFNTYY